MVRSPHVLDRSLSAEIADFIRGPEGQDIGEFIDSLSTLGDCAIFGGLPRDFARGGRQAFKSDVDIVVDVPPEVLDGVIEPVGGLRNRFGGYRLKHGRFEFDVWALQSTWAASSGHVRIQSLNDLVKTTFFDCDAVLFHCRTLEISRSDSFWTSIEERVVDINLEANPHYIGTLTRALSIIIDRGEKLSPRLASYLARGITGNRKEILDYASDNDLDLNMRAGFDLDGLACALTTQRSDRLRPRNWPVFSAKGDVRDSRYERLAADGQTCWRQFWR